MTKTKKWTLASNLNILTFTVLLAIGCGTGDSGTDVRDDLADAVTTDSRADAVSDVERDAGDVPYDTMDTGFITVTSMPQGCRVGKMCEVDFKIDAAPVNPFDQEEITIDAEVTGPSAYTGSRPAFWYQGFENNSGAPGAAEGEPGWRLRFMPVEPGEWNIQFVTRLNGDRIVSQKFPVDVAGNAADWKGVVGVSDRDGRYLSFKNEAPFFPIGENMCWWDADVTDYTGKGENPGWMKNLSDNGGNFIRLWMATWGFSLEWSYPDGSALGDYTARQDRAWALDRVFERADELGQMVMLCLISHGQYSTVFNSEWTGNPYNAINGGPLTNAYEFFTDETARKLTKNRLRYIVARWGAEPALMAWELFNEVDLTDKPEEFDPGVVRDWHIEMTDWLRAQDTLGHMVSSSISSGGELWTLDQSLFGETTMELAQVHHYGNAFSKFDIVRDVPGLAESYARFGKPVLFAELGVHSAGPADSLKVDPSFIGLHDLVWAPVFSLAAGSGMTWWWDNLIDPADASEADQYYLIKALADFVDGVDWTTEGFAAATPAVTVTPDGSAAGDPELKAFALVGGSTVLVWVKNMSEKYWNINEAADPAFIDGATLDLSGLPAGNWNAQWFDTFGQTTFPPEASPVANTMTYLPVPAFTHDIALRLALADDAPQL